MSVDLRDLLILSHIAFPKYQNRVNSQNQKGGDVKSRLDYRSVFQCSLSESFLCIIAIIQRTLSVLLP